MKSNDSVSRWIGQFCGLTEYPKNRTKARQRLYKNVRNGYQLQIRSVSTNAILEFLHRIDPHWGTIHEGFPNSMQQAFPPNTRLFLIRTKLMILIDAGLITGCLCGCRGDFTLTAKARYSLPSN